MGRNSFLFLRTDTVLLIAIVSFLLVSCKQSPESNCSVLKVDSAQYENNCLELFKLTNANGMFIKVTNYAASLTDVFVPDKKGTFGHVVLGFDSLEMYLRQHPKFGATIGRFANRIKNAEFTLEGRTYYLEKNNKRNSIHGGKNGFNRRIFKTDTCYAVKDTAVVIFKYKSLDLEEGFPGNLDLSVAYKLTSNNEVVLEYIATTDKPTILNLTNHSYFNLTGGKASVLNHIYKINADSITPVDSTGVPTGELVSVSGTKYDFRMPRSLENEVKRSGIGYDVNYKLNKCSNPLELAAVVTEPLSGRVLKAYTTEPGMQFYISNSTMKSLVGHGNISYSRFWGFCLEMQHFPDSPNHPQFPTTVLFPNDVYRQVTVYKFETLSN